MDWGIIGRITVGILAFVGGCALIGGGLALIKTLGNSGHGQQGELDETYNTRMDNAKLSGLNQIRPGGTGHKGV